MYHGGMTRGRHVQQAFSVNSTGIFGTFNRHFRHIQQAFSAHSTGIFGYRRPEKEMASPHTNLYQIAFPRLLIVVDRTSSSPEFSYG
jgi:hypothetical protein